MIFWAEFRPLTGGASKERAVGKTNSASSGATNRETSPGRRRLRSKATARLRQAEKALGHSTGGGEASRKKKRTWDQLVLAPGTRGQVKEITSPCPGVHREPT